MRKREVHLIYGRMVRKPKPNYLKRLRMREREQNPKGQREKEHNQKRERRKMKK